LKGTTSLEKNKQQKKKISQKTKKKKKKKNNLEIGATSAWLKGYIAH